MKVVACVVSLLLLAAAAPAAAQPLTQTFNAPLDRVWANAEAVLRQLGWDIDKADRTIGWITTESRRLDGEEYGVYAKGTRHRVRLQLRAAGESRTAVTVERTVFKRERILWVDNDEPIPTTDQSVEKDLLARIGKTL